jgi:formate/nitrite transporter FocA (FNT family)
MEYKEIEEEKELPQKSYRTILKQEIVAGLSELKRPASGLFLSSFSAGMDIGFSLILMAAMLTSIHGLVAGPFVHIILANLYSVGFILVILGRSELFTEHTALAVLPVLDGHAGLLGLARVWGIVFAGNIAGAGLIAMVAAWIGPALGIINAEALVEIAVPMVSPDWWLILISAILAGWLMGELAWLLAAGRDTISQIVFVWLVTTAIGFIGLHHCIAGTVEVLAGVFVSPDLGWTDFGRFLFWATLGNAIGGSVFVSLIKYGHASQDIPGKNVVEE